MKDSRFEETLLHDDISNFTEDDITQTYESVISDLENAKDSFHIENEIEKTIIKTNAIVFPAACLVRNHRELQAERSIEIPMKGNPRRFQENRRKIASKLTCLLREKLSKIARTIAEKKSEFADRKLFDTRIGKIVTKIPFGITITVIVLCVMFNKRIHDNDILDRFKLDCLTVKSVFDSRIFSYSLIHMNLEHLIPNLVILSLFGSIVEIKLGTLNLLISYFSMCYLIGLGWYFRKVILIGQCTANQNSVIGSSGAVYGIMTIAFLVCLFETLPKTEKNERKMKYRFWNLFGSLATLFAISVLYLNEIVFNPNEKTATDVHIIGSIVGLPFFILLLAKDSIFNYFQRK